MPITRFGALPGRRSVDPGLSYLFYGDHALSGEPRTIDGLRRWWERSVRLMPNPTFEVDEVIVAGGPWAIRIATRVRVHAKLPDGSPTTTSSCQ
jgi:hypothetical protein